MRITGYVTEITQALDRTSMCLAALLTCFSVEKAGAENRTRTNSSYNEFCLWLAKECPWLPELAFTNRSTNLNYENV